MSLKRVSDGGIYLLGWWWLSLSLITLHHRRIRVLAQCKAEKKTFSQNYVHDIEGLGTVALLLSELQFTTASLTRALGSSVPLLLMYLPPPVLISQDLRVETILGEVGSAF
ncbi:hypothetical protein EDB19DRAFT_1917006 [Suillus lakei]|nr:hypothetical protein EDB19DRAFT_1917006 [Suillus lakei]